MTPQQDLIEVRPIREGDQRRLETTFSIDAPADAVWEALTNADELTVVPEGGNTF